MPVTFQNLETKNVVRTLAAGTLTRLRPEAAFARTTTRGIGGIPLGQYFNKGDFTSIRRIKDFGLAQNYDPRSGVDAQQNDAEYVTAQLELEALFTKGHPVWSHDALVSEYVRDFSDTIGDATRGSYEGYLYGKFRDWTALPTSGTVFLDAHAPIKIVQREDSTGKIQTMSDAHLLDAEVVMQNARVPQDGRWYGRLAPSAFRGLESDVTLVTGFAGAQASVQPGSQLIVSGAPIGMDFSRRGWMVAKSTSIAGQSAVSGIADYTVTAATADTTNFFINDTSVGGVNIPLGAIRLTIGTAAATLSAAVAVGAIARLGAVGATALAYGVILRVDTVGKFIWMVPYDQSGTALLPAQIPASTVFSIPQIGSVNPFYHSESILSVSRLLQPPSDGSGATASYAIDNEMGMIFQIFMGSYNIRQFREGIQSALLCGAKASDWRKGLLVLSN
jgi:hypothetical protein